MANRRFEMFHYQQILFHMRSGESDRELARAGVVGRRKAGEVRKEAVAQGWLDPARPLPSEAELAGAFAQRPQQAGNNSSVAPYRAQIQAWVAKGIDGTTIHRTLVRNHGFTGSYSAVRRFMQSLPNDQAKASVILDFAPSEAAQVDFGAGPKFIHPHSGAAMPSWFFVMPLCTSRPTSTPRSTSIRRSGPGWPVIAAPSNGSPAWWKK